MSKNKILFKKLLCVVLAVLPLTFAACTSGRGASTPDVGNDDKDHISDTAGDRQDSSAVSSADSTSSESNAQGEDTSSGETTAKPLFLSILDGAKSNYKFIRAEDASQGIVRSVANLNARLKDVTSVSLGITSDWVKQSTGTIENNDPEIIIGSTNRAETARVLATLPQNGYAMQIVNGKLVIVGADDNLTVLALFEFEKRIMKNPEKCKKNYLSVSEEDCFVIDFGAKFQLSDIIAGGYSMVCSAKEVIHCLPVGDCYVSQGAASDGKYAYFVLRTSGDVGAVICKYELDTGKFVANSDVIYLGHGNDMTYDSAKHQLVVAHGQSEGKILTIIDPDTLKLVGDINITHGSGAITYSVATGKYAISQGGSTLHIMTADIKHIVSYSRKTGTGYTAQGMGSDEHYVYFPMSGSSDNILQVYDWNGNYATQITVPVALESESMFWVNDTYYISFYKSRQGAFLYRLDTTIYFE